MVADLIEYYKDEPALQFIRDVGVDWDKSITLNAEIGDYITIARKEKNTDSWFLGSITDETRRTIDISLDFLDSEIMYRADIYEDSKDAHWKDKS